MNAPSAPHWHGYYDADELDEIRYAIQTTAICSNGVNLRVRVYEQSGNVPTVMVGHGLLGYGLAFARFHLPFWRRGWRVIQFDLPGMGESEGTRGAATVQEMIAAWRDVSVWVAARFDSPRFAMGNAEDGVLAYYALANDPTIAGLSVHTLFEYGDVHAVGWIHPRAAVRVLRPVLGSLERVSTRFSLPGHWTIPWNHVFAGPDDKHYRKHLADDPLSLRRGRITLGRSLISEYATPVPFEACETPVQVIISTRSRIWPAGSVRHSAERLGGPHEIIEIEEPHWKNSRAFHDRYCALVATWFERWMTPR